MFVWSPDLHTAPRPLCWGPVPLLLPFSLWPHFTTPTGPLSTTAFLPAVRTIIYIPGIHQPAPSTLQEKLQLRFQLFPIPLDTRAQRKVHSSSGLLSLTRKGEHVNTKTETDCR